MDWLNLIPRSNIVSSITRMISTTAEYRLTYQPVFRSPISAVLHGNHACDASRWRYATGGVL